MMKKLNIVPDFKIRRGRTSIKPPIIPFTNAITAKKGVIFICYIYNHITPIRN